MTDHYQTKHILKRAAENANGLCTLVRGVRMSKPTDKEPDAPSKIAAELNEIFHRGGELILETYRDWDDEGGECYEAFIVDSADTAEFFGAFDRVVNQKQPPDLVFVHRWIITYPEKIWHVWAGPY